MRKLIASALTLSALVGCNEEITGPDPAVCEPFMASYGVAVGDTVVAAQGLRYIDVKTGSGGAVANGSGVAVHYSLYQLSNGLALQSTCASQIPFGPFILGAGSVVPGFERGIVGMQLGGVRRLIVPSSLAYPAGSGGQLAGVNLVWDVQLTQTEF
jgi:FKBP-type peptidyl-prolyl cis-trans isomerase